MKIGLLSDTHGYLDPKVLDHFRDCDEVWHAGDIGSEEVADALEKFKPLRAVYGNIDDRKMQSRYPEDQRFTCGGLAILMTHIGGAPPRYNQRVNDLLSADPPAIFICGHTHILRVYKDSDRNGLLYLNPGAAGHHGFHPMRTLLRFEIDAGKVQHMEVIEIGKRGKIEQ